MINNNEKIFGLIGLAARARKICFGADSVEQEIKKKKVYLVIIAKDSSDKTKSKFINLCESYNIEYVVIGDIDKISKTIGKVNKAIVGIKEQNLASQINKKYIDMNKKINYGGEDIG